MSGLVIFGPSEREKTYFHLSSSTMHILSERACAVVPDDEECIGELTSADLLNTLILTDDHYPADLRRRMVKALIPAIPLVQETLKSEIAQMEQGIRPSEVKLPGGGVLNRAEDLASQVESLVEIMKNIEAILETTSRDSSE